MKHQLYVVTAHMYVKPVAIKLNSERKPGRVLIEEIFGFIELKIGEIVIAHPVDAGILIRAKTLELVSIKQTYNGHKCMAGILK